MTDHLQTLANSASLFAALCISSTAAVIGIVPRAGPGRALVLALTSFLRVAKTPSLRFKDVASLDRLLRCISSNQFAVVTGTRGIGKSVVVDTTTQRTSGVTSIFVRPDTSQCTIVMEALSGVANTSACFVHPHSSVRRILWWHRLFFPPPIVVLRIGERGDGQDFAEIPGAARELAGFGLRVLVDGSANSLPPELFRTTRQIVLELEDMPLETLRRIPAFAGLFDMLRVENLESAVWGVLGGVPADYEELVAMLKGADCSGPDNRRVVLCYLRSVISKAIDCRDSLLAGCPAMREVLGEFKGRAEVRKSLLAEKRIPAQTTYKVLRTVLTDEGMMLVPVDAATALVLTHDFRVPPTIEALLDLLSPPAVAPVVVV